jgi:hypothetical protein
VVACPRRGIGEEENGNGYCRLIRASNYNVGDTSDLVGYRC